MVSILMGTGNKVYLNYGVAAGQNLKLIRTGLLNILLLPKDLTIIFYYM